MGSQRVPSHGPTPGTQASGPSPRTPCLYPHCSSFTHLLPTPGAASTPLLKLKDRQEMSSLNPSQTEAWVSPGKTQGLL